MSWVESYLHTFVVNDIEPKDADFQPSPGTEDHSAKKASTKSQKLATAKESASNEQVSKEAVQRTPVAPLCAFSEVAWIPTEAGDLTIREVYERAHTIAGLRTNQTGAEYSTVTRMLASLTALLLRDGTKVRRVQGRFAPEDIDRLEAMVKPYMDVFHPERPFLQRHHEQYGDFVISQPAKLYSWHKTEEVNMFFDRNADAKTFDIPTAVRALSVFMTHAVGGNSSLKRVDIEGKSFGHGLGSAGIQWPGAGYSSVEVMFAGENLFDTMMRTTPTDWVTEGGFPAWMDPLCERSSGLNGVSPLWAQTWSPNQAFCQWNDSHTLLTGVAIGGASALPPGLPEPEAVTVARSKAAGVAQPALEMEQLPPWERNVTDKAHGAAWKATRKAFIDEKQRVDPFHLWTTTPKVKTIVTKGFDESGEPTETKTKVTTFTYQAHRPNFTGLDATLAGWYKDDAMKALIRNGRRFVVDPDQYDYTLFISHLCKGTATSGQVRSSKIYRETVGCLISEEQELNMLEEASKKIAEVGKLVEFYMGKTDNECSLRAKKLFWMAVTDRSRQFFEDPDSVDKKEFWQMIRTAAFSAYDRAARLKINSSGVHSAEHYRAKLSAQIHTILENFV